MSRADARCADGALISKLAERLWVAETSRQAVPALTDALPALTVEDAYAIQQHNLSRREREGSRLVGRKIGLTSKAMQDQLGVDEPDLGGILSDMVVDESQTVSLRRLISPRVETEIAFLLKEDIPGPGIGVLEALTAVEGIVPAIEVIDSRIADWRITLVDTIADNASSARVVLGDCLTPVHGLNLRLIGAVLSRNGEVAETGAGAAVLGHPGKCVAWLANKLAGFGDTLRRGDVVLSGALHRAVPVTAGDSFRAELAGLGAVTVSFEA